jgi:hypothetical protein
MVNLLFRGIFFTVSHSVSVAARKLNPVSSFNLQYRFVDPRFMFEYRFRLNKGSMKAKSRLLLEVLNKPGHEKS